MKSAPSRSFFAAAAGIAAAAVLPAMLLAPLGSSGALALRSSQEAEALSDRIGVMAGGELLFVGTKEELYLATGKKNVEDAFIEVVTGGKAL